VWEALTNPLHVGNWYGGEGFTSPVCEMDVRPDGLWHHVMRGPNGMEFTVDSVFLEVVKPERLVWTAANRGERPQGGPPTAVTTVTLTDLGDKTLWTMEARFDSLADRDLSVRMGFGHMVSQGAERLAALLQSL
jgi:uncharacterized protein YndB with AHSA1/START domain